MLTDRQKNLLKHIIETHIKKPEPVASALLAKKLSDRVSSATIRNEMAALENEGYIVQPHTSAGRVPTAKAYEFFVANYFAPAKEKFLLNKKSEIMETDNGRQKIKILAKAVAEKSGLAAFAAFSPDDTYYTGLSNLFSQPEFAEREAVVSLSDVIDHFDQALSRLWNDDTAERVLIGDRSEVGDTCSLLVRRLTWQTEDALFGILGPLRMNYNLNISLLREAEELLKNNH